MNLVKDERIIVTPVNDIYYAEAHEKMTFVYTRREAYVMAMNITEFCSKLPESHLLPLPPLVLRESEQDPRDRTVV